MSAWLRASGDGVVLSLHVQPGAKRTEVVGLHGESLKIRLAAPPVDGKANQCLLDYVAEKLGVTKQQVTLLSGQTSRSKRVAVAGLTAAEIERKLLGEFSPKFRCVSSCARRAE